MSGFRLGIDLGTSNTAAVLRWPDGRVRPVLFDGSPLLPSAVYAEPGGAVLTGREARHSGRVNPQRYEPNPKRRIDDGVVLLGDDELPVTALLAAVVRQVRAEAERTVGGAVADVVLTCPAAWGPRRRAILTSAATAAGLGSPELVAEPIAAARYFVEVLGKTLSPGGCLVVYDFGAGTFDVSVVRHGGDGFVVLAEQGLADVGGLDIDAAVVGYLGATYASRYPDQWRRLEQPETTADRRARRLLWDDVRSAKEILSRTSSALIPIPLLDTDAPLGREQLERLARPLLDRTVAATRTAIRTAGITPADVHGIFLVGGSSRIPLVSTLLHRECGIAPTAIEQPELVVAEGAAVLPTATPSPAPIPPTPPAESAEQTWPEPVTASALVPPSAEPSAPSVPPAPPATSPAEPVAPSAPPAPPATSPAEPAAPSTPPAPVSVAEQPAAPERAGRATRVLAGVGALIAAVFLVAWPLLDNYNQAKTRDLAITINGVPVGDAFTVDLDQPITLAGQVPEDVPSEWDDYEVAVSFGYLGYGMAEVHVPKTVTGDSWSAEVTPPAWLDDLAGGAMDVHVSFYHDGGYLGGVGWSSASHFVGVPLWSVVGVGATLTLAGAVALLAVLRGRIRRGDVGISGFLLAAAMALLTALWAFVLYIVTREGSGEEVLPILGVAVGTYVLLGVVGWRGARRLAAFVGVPGGVAVWLLTICLARLDAHLADVGRSALFGAVAAVAALTALTHGRLSTSASDTTSRPTPAAIWVER